MPSATMAQSRTRFDRLAQARREVPAADRQRAAELWSAEARVWANLTRAPDFPVGTPSGALLTQAAIHAERYADARAASWQSHSPDSDLRPPDAS